MEKLGRSSPQKATWGIVALPSLNFVDINIFSHANKQNCYKMFLLFSTTQLFHNAEMDLNNPIIIIIIILIIITMLALASTCALEVFFFKLLLLLF